MKMHVCDLCKKKTPDAKIKYKYKAEKFCRFSLHSGGWKKIELCQDCLDKIIRAKEENISNE